MNARSVWMPLEFQDCMMEVVEGRNSGTLGQLGKFWVSLKGLYLV